MTRRGEKGHFPDDEEEEGAEEEESAEEQLRHSTFQAIEEEPIDLGGLPENWQDFVTRRIQAGRSATRKREDDDRKTMDEVFDRQTLLILYKFISNGHIETLDYPLSTGKEANVFHATTPQGGSI